VLALLIYMVYNNCLSVAQAWVAQERIGLVVGLWGVHLAMLAVLAVLFGHRLLLFSFWRLLR
jgi:lipopolysaccharide export system permease protein